MGGTSDKHIISTPVALWQEAQVNTKRVDRESWPKWSSRVEDRLMATWLEKPVMAVLADTIMVDTIMVASGNPQGERKIMGAR